MATLATSWPQLATLLVSFVTRFVSDETENVLFFCKSVTVFELPQSIRGYVSEEIQKYLVS